MKRLLMMDDFLNWDPEEIEEYCYLDAGLVEVVSDWPKIGSDAKLDQLVHYQLHLQFEQIRQKQA